MSCYWPESSFIIKLHQTPFGPVARGMLHLATGLKVARTLTLKRAKNEFTTNWIEIDESCISLLNSATRGLDLVIEPTCAHGPLRYELEPESCSFQGIVFP